MSSVLSGEGIDILVSAKPLGVHGLNGESVSVAVRTDSGERKIEGSHLLVATGRIANTADIGLDKAGIAVDARGFIRVDERLRTTAAGVWAIGECAGSPQFTCRSTISESSGTTWRAGTVRRMIGSFRMWCSPIRRSRAS